MAAQQPELQQRSVVSSFIISLRGSPRVALFRRSDSVNTYRHRLAPISGTIEPHESPVAAAWRELKEETTLTARDIELWRHGKSYTFSDPSIRRQWTIYPFAFRLKHSDEGGRGEEAIKIDWEHDGWEWFDLRDIQGDEFGVPRLADSLHRVWFEAEMSGEASQALRSGLQQLKNDHRSGSHELTTIALTGYRDVLVHLRDDSNWWRTARMAAWHMCKNGRESMSSATQNAFLAVLSDLEKLAGSGLDNGSAWDYALDVVDSHLEKRRAMPARVRDSFTAYLNTTFMQMAESQSTLTILTLSASSTIRDSILDAFASLPISNLDIRILESRPLFEGASMASSLVSEFQTRFSSRLDRHLRLAVYTDASAAIAADGVDFVLLGADCISSEGWISNKTGSLPAVLAARYASPSVKVLVFSQLEKVAEPGSQEDHNAENNDPVELMTPWLGSDVKGLGILQKQMDTPPDTSNCVVEVKNIYFEWVPVNLIDRYVCEEGTVSRKDIKAKAYQVKEKADRYLGSL
ncbi:hypothetical protein N7476_003766 [Penicillium atrosanguineum]|uniref:Nudix hydrolase domain-containing protein n=1 Tax=Penicillium atrosanguineum TaxID=1132637 RepID=A0A9W9PZ14_9EURO|nr:hypothetical protein N7526_003369 [Penicillium atrosanguineum]KAJ5320764.1 hypothetical protein N7476_003766 [Penicillium atrosanguineum]